MGRAGGIKQQAKISGVRRRGSDSSADDILFGQLTPVRPTGGARSYRHEGMKNGRRCEFWTSDPDVTTAEEATERCLLHREDGPAYILYDGDHVESELWAQNGAFHREDGPAVTRYFSNGMPRIEEWYYQGREHRDGGPAEITYDEIAASEGQQVIEDEVWWSHGQMDDVVEAS
jgi:hypothetical protein